MIRSSQYPSRLSTCGPTPATFKRGISAIMALDSSGASLRPYSTMARSPASQKLTSGFCSEPQTEALAYCCQLLRSWSLRASFGKRVRKHGARFRMIFVTKNWQKIAVVLPLFVLPNSSVQFKEVCSCVLPRARGCRISENQSINKRRNAKARTHVDKCGGCEERSKSISDCRRSGLKSPC